ncbi:M14 family metallopeptidase [Flammeovirga sp. MY04]|uniref:M14 family metallopeptidase n=1 Tax=Flammeovirga sp. MY04 TaxID=1191459 RepID=UPI0008062AFA|nr:M14 family metallopeptidase [Flammeovirga sp. MY04]ANQ47772.1 M14 family metallopeptidase [Flammeovirga sp. MY04]
MKKYFFYQFILIGFLISCDTKQEQPLSEEVDWSTVFEKTNGKETFTYQEGIDYLQKLNKHYEKFHVLEYGTTDAGYPLHLGIYTPDENYLPTDFKEKNVLLINNAIHPGEPDGVDASFMLVRNILQGKEDFEVKNTIIAFIPFYNIGGALNRNTGTRANQEGPHSYGFRGNAQNLDLNRDFIKMDSKNMKTLAEIFHLIQPDLFIDTHVSNGADYQYTLTYLASHEGKLGEVGKFVKSTMNPYFEKNMEEKGWPIVPYVNVWGTTPDKGYRQFYDSPRYSSGYAALFNVPSYVIETHMLKPFKQRTQATYEFLKQSILLLEEKGDALTQVMKKERNQQQLATYLPIKWQIDESVADTLNFRGYKGEIIKSKVSGLDRLYYDRSKPYTKKIPFYSGLTVVDSVKVPAAYIIPKGYQKVVEMLKQNNIDVEELPTDIEKQVMTTYIDDFQTVNSPYEGHYLHYDIKTSEKEENIKFLKGDYLIKTDNQSKRFLVEVLTARAQDSYFAWNFFDAILQQKEHFSSYVFEDKAAKLLKENPQLLKELEDAKKRDTEMRKSAYKQLNFIYDRSNHKETSYRRYPVYSVYH